MKSPERLMRLYDESVGRGTNLNLNIPPDRRGRIADPDLAALKSFGDALKAGFATDLARQAVATATDTRGRGFEAARVLDGDPLTYWSTPDAATTPSLTLDLPPGAAFDLIRLREYLPLGVRVTRFAVEAEVDGAWRTLATHECIGAQRLIRLPAPITARRVRLHILAAPACPAITEFALFRSVAPAAVPRTMVTDRTTLSMTGWTIASASGPGAAALIDDDAETSWTVPAPTPGQPARVTIDVGAAQAIAGFSLTPERHPMTGAAAPKGYVAETSVDGRTWETAGSGEFANIAYALSTQRITFAAPHLARYLRLSFPALAVAAARLAIAGIGAFTAPR